ncbi:DUF58 domain-containing protein [Nocardioides rubriscoriae]|uniref:DUF58 domain-containing protein n=1 Tax=Nocardioides rubriscoriae TaxID=642762 RepID=UPI0011DFA423|nr:DUF58 domain-containing protein [Nocardioides rubriscoriae]
MSGPVWHPTGGLVRAVVVGAVGLGWAVVGGEPALLVLTAPLLVAAVPAVLRRPRGVPSVHGMVDRASMHEGQSAVLGLHVRPAAPADVEQVTRVVSPVPFERATPADGHQSVLHPDVHRDVHRDGEGREVEVSPRRWGVWTLGEERVALTSAWGGFRWGPVVVPGRQVRVHPAAAYSSRAESPRPRGLVGAHRSDRPGSGTELAGIRSFQSGDRLRRINWRVSARTGTLHVTTTRAEQDAGLLLVVDLYAEHGVSGGVDGAPSSLDLTVRAAAALAEHAVRTGDRVALRPIGGRSRPVPPGAGRRHLRRVLGTLADVRTGSTPYDDVSRLDLRVGAGTTVVVLTPLLVDAVATTAADLVRRGLPTVVVDTLPPDARPDLGDNDAGLVDLAWRMRLLEREHVRLALDAAGCPVVTWRGPGTVDEVFRRLARRRPRAGSAP